MFELQLQIFGDLHTNDTTNVDSGADNPSLWRSEIDSFMSAFSGLTETGEASNVPVVDSSGVLNVKALNVTTPDTTSHTQQISIDDLPTASLDGNINNWEYEGLTLVNQATADDTDSEAVTDNDVLYLDTSGQFNPTSGSDLSIALANSDVYFVYIKLQSDSSEIDEIKSGDGSTAIGATTVFTSGLEVYQQVTSGGTTASKIAVVASETGNLKIKSAIFVNQTVLGIASYTEAQMLDLVRGGYFEGIENTKNPKLSTDNKNKFNKNTVTYNFQVDNTDGTDTASTGETASDYIKIDENEDYYISGCSGTTNTDGSYYDSDKVYISGFTAYGALTIPTRTAYIRFTVDIDDLDTAQLENGTASSTYVEFDSSTAQAECELRRVPNGTADKLYESDGKVYKLGNISEDFVFDGDEGWAGYTNGAGVGSNLSYMNLVDYALNNNIKVNNSQGGIGYDGSNIYEQATGVSSLSSFGIVPLLSNDDLYIAIPTASLGSDDATGFTNYLSANPVTAIFELTTPVTTDLTAELKASGLLQSFEDGTMYLENGYKKTHLASSTTVTLSSALSEITSIKYELSGEIVELTTDDYSFTAGGTSITGLPTADVEYFVEGLLTFNISGSFTGDVATDTGAVIASNTKAINSLSEQVADQRDIIDLLLLMV